MTTTQENVISKVDRDVFERALAIMLKHRELIYRGDFKRRLDEREEPWDAIGRHAALVCQVESMGLKAWQVAPCEVEINEIDAPGYEHRRTRHASLTLERLLNGGLSRYEPDPPAALERIEGESAA
jgi:hypothetical protein